MSGSTTRGPHYIPPPASIFRRRPFIDPGVLAAVAALAALLFVFVLTAMLENGLGFRLGDVVHSLISLPRH